MSNFFHQWEKSDVVLLLILFNIQFFLPIFVNRKEGMVGKEKIILIENVTYSDVKILCALHPTRKI